MEKRPPWTSPSSPSLSVEIRTPRLVLRAPRPSDIPALRYHFRQSVEHLRPWSPASRGVEDDPYSLTALSKNVLRQRREWKLGVTYAFLMTAPAHHGAKVVGRVNLNQVTRGVFQNAYLGYEVDVECLGEGFATEGVGAALEFAFRALQLHRVQAAIMPRNLRSLRVVDKLGFKKEGFAERYLCIAGAWEDHFLFATTYEDWNERATTLEVDLVS